MDLREVGYDARNIMDLAEDKDKFSGVYKGDNEPSGSLKSN